MSGVALASFPNSRVKPRNAATERETLIYNVPAAPGILVYPANPNRTDSLFTNEGPFPINYAYDALSIGSDYNTIPVGESRSIEIQTDIFFQGDGGISQMQVDQGQG